MRLIVIGLSLLIGLNFVQAQNPEIWNQFVDAKLNGTEPILPDFSYAGYNYSETELPNIDNWDEFNVVDYGAIPNDLIYDDVPVQAAIDAAEANGGGIVKFPIGKFLFSPSDYLNTISIRGSNIVLKGEGSGIGETELFVENMNILEWKFEFRPDNLFGTEVATIVSEAQRETFEIEVEDASQLSEGQKIIIRAKNAAEFAEDYYGPRALLAEWTAVLTDFRMKEIHTIKSICGNTVTLREPLHITLKPQYGDFTIDTYSHLSENGIEDIRFSSGWVDYPEEFSHHKDQIHDYGWQGVRLRNISNGWVKDCVFDSWNRAIALNGCSMITMENLEFTGKKGHFGPSANTTYGALIKNCEDNIGNHHGPSISNYSTGVVYQNYQMNGVQRVDSHGSGPYANLYDNVRDGFMFHNGSATSNLPNHGRHLVFWNFKLNGGPDEYNFWLDSMPGSSGRHFYADPIFVGLHGDPVTLVNTGVNESQNTSVNIISLFDAQFDLRTNALDFDHDEIPDAVDRDDDNDGILDVDEGTGDFDLDGMPNHQDLDSDNDGCFDALEGTGDFTISDLTDVGAIDQAVNSVGLFCGAGQQIGTALDEANNMCCTTQPDLCTFIEITSPTSNSLVATGENFTILWNSNVPGNVSVVLYKGESYVGQINSNTANSGSYIWSVPEDLEEADDYQIRVRSLDNPEFDDFSSFFTVSSCPEVGTACDDNDDTTINDVEDGNCNCAGELPYIEITSPTATTHVEVGSNYMVEWNSNVPGNVRVVLYKGESFVGQINSNTANSGSYIWSVPEDLEEADDYQIRVRSLDNPDFDDFSPFFTVNTSCELISNGDFSKALTDWSLFESDTQGILQIEPNGFAKIEVITPASNDWKLALRQANIPLQQGKSYTISYDAYADANRSTEIILSKIGGSQYANLDQDITTIPTRYTAQFTMNSMSDDLAIFNFNVGATAIDVYINNISISEADCDPSACNLVVTNINDTGPASLKEAISCAEDGAIISISNALADQSIFIQDFPIIINKNLTIQGHSDSPTSLNATNVVRLFEVLAGVTLQINDVHLVGGQDTSSHVILNHGTTRLTGVEVFNSLINANLNHSKLGGNGVFILDADVLINK